MCWRSCCRSLISINWCTKRIARRRAQGDIVEGVGAGKTADEAHPHRYQAQQQEIAKFKAFGSGGQTLQIALRGGLIGFTVAGQYRDFALNADPGQGLRILAVLFGGADGQCGAR